MKKVGKFKAIIATLLVLFGLSGQAFAEGVGCQHGDEMTIHMSDDDSMPCCDELTCSMVHCFVVVPLITHNSFSVSNFFTPTFFVYKNAYHNIHAPPLDRPPIS